MSLAAKCAPLDSPPMAGGVRHTLRIYLLGEFVIRQANLPIPLDTPSHQALLAYLLLNPKQAHTRQHLAFTFWPDSSEDQARTNLRKALFNLRQLLPQPDQFLWVTRNTVTWREAAPYVLDVDQFETAVQQALEAANPVDSKRLLEEAQNLYQGELLPGHYDDWILKRRELLHQQYLSCLSQHLQLLEASRDYAAAAGTARRLLQAEPLHEPAYRQLMRLQALNGDRAGALRTYHSCVTILQRELNITPGVATQNSYRQLLSVENVPAKQPPRRIPLVGRHQAWSRLQSAWKQAARQRPYFALIHGEAGIGKTRLAEELLNWASRQGITSLRTACYAPASNLPYGPVVAWLQNKTVQHYFDQLDDKWLREISRVWPEVVETRPELKPAGPITNSWQREHLFSALSQAILKQPKPFILFIDDLQWCDLDTLEWLCFLLRFKPRARFLILSTVREEEISTNHSLSTLLCGLQRKSDFVEIELKRFDPATTAELARQVTGERLTAGQSDRLFTETEGIPLFIVEMARAGLEMLADNGQIAPTDRATPAPLPEKMQAVINWRLANLSPAARDLLELAATIGRFFTFDLLAVASGRSEPELVRSLDELWRQRIVREQGTEAYDFSHDKLRQVAYASLSIAKRRLLHGRIIEALETLYADDLDRVSAQLALHYEARQRWQKVVDYYQRAAQVSNRVFAHQETTQYLRRAISLLPQTTVEPRQQMELHELLGDVLALKGEDEAAREAFETAVAHTADPIQQSQLYRKIAGTWHARHINLEKALQILDVAENRLGELTETTNAMLWKEWLWIQIDRFWVFYLMHLVEEMAQLAQQIRSRLEQFGSPVQRGLYLIRLVLLAYHRERYVLTDETVRIAQDALTAMEETGRTGQITFAHFVLGMTHLWCGWDGNLDEAETHMLIALNEAEEIGDVVLQARCLTYLTTNYRRREQLDKVRSLLPKARKAAEKANAKNYLVHAKKHAAWVAWREGNLKEVLTLGQEALDLHQSISNYTPFLGDVLWPLIGAALRQDDIETAMSHVPLLLNPNQKRMPDALTDLLQQAITTWEANQPESTQNCLQKSLQLAQTYRYL